MHDLLYFSLNYHFTLCKGRFLLYVVINTLDLYHLSVFDRFLFPGVFLNFYRWSYGDIESKNRASAQLLCSACDTNTELLWIRYLQGVLSLKCWRMLGRPKHIIHFPIKQSCLSYVISSVCPLEYFCSVMLWESRFFSYWDTIISH